MIRKIGLEADSEACIVILLQGFATRSSQFFLFLTSIIWLSTKEASIKFFHRKKTFPTLRISVPIIFYLISLNLPIMFDHNRQTSYENESHK